MWTLELDGAGAETSHRVERAWVRSRVQLDYPSTQAALDAGQDTPAALLPEIGRARLEQERLRGGASLNLPDEEIVRDASGQLPDRAQADAAGGGLERAALPDDRDGRSIPHARCKVGILRTMPAPDEKSIDAFRARTVALGLPWREGQAYGEYLRGLDRDDPRALAVLQAAVSLFRGAGYAAFDGEPPADSVQAAVAAPYAHVTAPLRRLVDRWGLVVCAAASSGGPVPDWARTSLPLVPDLMAESTKKASQLSSGSINRVEAALLRDRVGERFPAIVLEVFEGKARIQLTDPVVTASCHVASDVAAGTTITVTCTAADIEAGTVGFSS